MKQNCTVRYDDIGDPVESLDEAEEPSEQDLWFLPGPVEEGPDFPHFGPRAEPTDRSVLADWTKAEADFAAHLARVAGRLGALDERLRRSPEGWRHRLALVEAADLS